MNTLQEILGESVTPEAVEAIEKLVQTRIDESVESKDEDVKQDLKEKEELVESLYQEIADLKEAHDADLADLKERADLYGEHLQEQAEKYAEKVKQETIEEMIEKADAYGDYLQEQAEKYGQCLIEKADAYGDYLQEHADTYAEKVLAEAKVEHEKHIVEVKQEATDLLEQFKTDHKAEFEKLDEHHRMANVFSSLTTLIESSGFTLDENKQFERLNRQLEEAQKEKRDAQLALRESEKQVKKFNIERLIESVDPNIAYTDKERITRTSLRTRCKNEDELKEVVTTLVENTQAKHVEQSKAQTLTESVEQKNVKTQVSGWADKLV